MFEQYPYPPVPAPPLTHRDEIQRQESRESAPHKSLKAMLRPCFKEPDLLNWRKASENNEKWVGFLSSEETKRFYDDDGNQMYAHSSGSSHREGADTKSASSLISESSCGISEDEMKSAGAAHAATEAQKDSETKSANLKVLGVAVIRDAIVVNSTAYLQVSYVLHNLYWILLAHLCWLLINMCSTPNI